jgi:hypothetical protein
MDVPNGSRGTRLAGKVAIVTGAGFDGDFLGTGAAISTRPSGTAWLTST